MEGRGGQLRHPGAGDNAFLVLPYQMTVCPGGTCITQPVPVTYRSNTNPVLNRVVISSDNLLTQRELPFVTLAQLNLTANYRDIGSGGAFTPPPGVPLPIPPGVYPRGGFSQPPAPPASRRNSSSVRRK